MKSEKTIEIENALWRHVTKQGVFGCFETTIGWFGKERVDLLTYDTNGTWRCYEIKVSLSDFHSKNHNTFIGHYNYYAIPYDLFDLIKTEIPKHVGVIVLSSNGGESVKKAKRVLLKEDEQVLKNSLIRSLCRDLQKQRSGENTFLVDQLNGKIRKLEKEKRELFNELCNKD